MSEEKHGKEMRDQVPLPFKNVTWKWNMALLLLA